MYSTCMQQPACVQLSKQHTCIMCSMYTAAIHFCEGYVNNVCSLQIWYIIVFQIPVG